MLMDASFRSRLVFDRSKCGAQIEGTQQNQHQRHTKFQSHPEPFGNNETEKNDGPANHEQGETVSDPQKIPVKAALRD